MSFIFESKSYPVFKEVYTLRVLEYSTPRKLFEFKKRDDTKNDSRTELRVQSPAHISLFRYNDSEEEDSMSWLETSLHGTWHFTALNF
jgi:hypothetical protein